MKKCTKLFALALAVMLMAAPALSLAEQEYERPSIVAHKADGVVIDGDLSDWNLDSPAVLDRADQLVRDGNFWNGVEDLSAKLYLAWDEEFIYLAAEITEDTPLGCSSLPIDGEDNIILFISTDPTLDPNRYAYDTKDWMVYLLMYEDFWDTAIDRDMVEDKQRFVSVGVDGGESVLVDYECAYQLTPTTNGTGFNFECKFSWASLSKESPFAKNSSKKSCTIEKYEPQVGDELLCNFAITDIDYPCPGTEYIPVIAWSGQSLDYIKTYPITWGSVTLAE